MSQRARRQLANLTCNFDASDTRADHDKGEPLFGRFRIVEEFGYFEGTVDPATQFQIISAEQARDTIVANLGLGAELSKSVTVFLDYNGLFSSTMNTHAASAGLRATW